MENGLVRSTPLKSWRLCRLRESPPDELAGRTVTAVDDLADGLDGLPAADVLRFWLDGGGRVIVRPSGTEPVLRIYAEAKCFETVDELLALGEKTARSIL